MVRGGTSRRISNEGCGFKTRNESAGGSERMRISSAMDAGDLGIV